MKRFRDSASRKPHIDIYLFISFPNVPICVSVSLPEEEVTKLLFGSPDEASAEAREKACQQHEGNAQHEVLLGAVRLLLRLAQDGVLPEVAPELVEQRVEFVHLVWS